MLHEAAQRVAEIDGFGRFQIGWRQHRFVTLAAFEEVAAPGIGPNYPPPLRLTGMMRAEVRVYWNRLERAPRIRFVRRDRHEANAEVLDRVVHDLEQGSVRA